MRDKLHTIAMLTALVALFAMTCCFINGLLLDKNREQWESAHWAAKAAKPAEAKYEWRAVDLVDGVVELFFGAEPVGRWDYDEQSFRPYCVDRNANSIVGFYPPGGLPPFAPKLPKRGALNNGVIPPHKRPTGDVQP